MLTHIIRWTGLITINLIAFFGVTAVFWTNIYSALFPETFPGIKRMINLMEDRFYDVRMEKTLDRNYKDPDLVLAMVDDISINQIGRFPWKRETWVKVTDKLQQFGAKVIAYDIVFPENEEACSEVSPDILFGQKIADFQSSGENKIIIPYSLTPFKEEGFPELPDAMFNFMMDAKEETDSGFAAQYINKSTFPIPEILQAEPYLSYIGAVEDGDGIFRRYPLIANVKMDGQNTYYPSFAYQAYQLYTEENVVLKVHGSGEGEIQIGDKTLKLDEFGATKIRWTTDSMGFDNIPIIDIMNADINDQKMRKRIEGKLIFIGSTAFAAHDLRHTPVDAKLPGVYFHMNMVRMLMDGKFFNFDKSNLYSWALLAAGVLVMILISLLQNAILDIIYLILFSGALVYTDTYYFIPQGFQITLFFILLGVVGTYSWNTLINFYYANKDKQFLKGAFGNYISPELIDIMYESGEAPSLGGEVGIRTAYFTDIQSFSTFSEQLSAPQLVELLNEYLTAMTDILLEEGGTLDKYEGDAIIAFFGAPLNLEDHATRACRVAHRMQEALLVLREKWLSEGDKWPKIVHDMRMRIGINSGEIVTGNMGSKSRMNYTMMGDSVNLAARLEEAAKQYGIFTQVSSMTVDLCENIFVWRELDTLRVVGKSEPVTTFELMGVTEGLDDLQKQLAEKFNKGIQNYKGQNWDEAITIFQETLELEYQRFPELKGIKTNPSEIYIKRCEEFKANPPGEGWDGVYTLTSK